MAVGALAGHQGELAAEDRLLAPEAPEVLRRGDGAADHRFDGEGVLILFFVVNRRLVALERIQKNAALNEFRETIPP